MRMSKKCLREIGCDNKKASNEISMIDHFEFSCGFFIVAKLKRRSFAVKMREKKFPQKDVSKAAHKMKGFFFCFQLKLSPTFEAYNKAYTRKLCIQYYICSH